MTKLEEIARAIAKIYGIEDVGEDWEVFNWQFFDAARAVVEAMREPSEAMIEAGVSHRLTTHISGENNWPTDTSAMWRAMLDAILAPSETVKTAAAPQ